ncbi:hypothetical protein H2509_14645 [Stappia sp. F7233]|uniref:Uncharacterized protein n=1 Tax=Stappia albiluteola TaxID=2758565 RepID=A0A839AGU6_9HYPH|nr:DUF6101 family protein [Stappia albiluteola]MBA5778365.1 hypothetical protein [Stappia albiluteola]
MRRQTALQDAAAAGSSRALRLDPARLPHRFTAKADPLGEPTGNEAFNVYIDQQTVIMKRRLSGLPLTVVLPVGTFTGVYARVTPAPNSAALSISIGLHHRDPSLCVELFSGADIEAAAEDWRSWSSLLGLPLVAVEPNGAIRVLDDQAPTGTPRISAARRRVAALTNRRPRFLCRRKAGSPAARQLVHRGEYEIIARN